jgi:hypothetical protein
MVGCQNETPNFPHSKFDFLQRFNGFRISKKSGKIFFNGFPISSMAFQFLQWLSDFPQRLSTFREIRENLSMTASIQKIAIQASYSLRKNIQTLNILSFTNRHSPYSLASV